MIVRLQLVKAFCSFLDRFGWDALDKSKASMSWTLAVEKGEHWISKKMEKYAIKKIKKYIHIKSGFLGSLVSKRVSKSRRSMRSGSRGVAGRYGGSSSGVNSSLGA